MVDTPQPGPEPAPDRRPAALVAAVTVAAVVLAAGIVVWLTQRGGDELTSNPGAGGSTTTIPITTIPPPSTSAATTAPPSSVAATTVPPPATTPPSTVPDRFELPAADAATWTVESEFEPIAPAMALSLAATDGDVRVFDGVAGELRCVGVVGPGDDVTTWCGPPNVATSFLADRGLEPVLVELGEAAADVTIRRQAPGWTLAANGCSSPMSTILGGVDPGGLAVTGIACRGDDAFLGVGMALFGPGVAPDGGGILATLGDEGWNLVDFGTSLPCAGADGVDRCASFGVESELFEALLPLPPADVLGESSTDVVSVTDRTAEVEGWLDGASDPDAIVSIVTEQLVDPEAEVPATVRRSGALQFGRLQLLVVEIPQLDDAFAAETWAIWIGNLDETRGVTAFSWATCRRGVTGDGLCV